MPFNARRNQDKGSYRRMKLRWFLKNFEHRKRALAPALAAAKQEAEREERERCRLRHARQGKGESDVDRRKTDDSGHPASRIQQIGVARAVIGLSGYCGLMSITQFIAALTPPDTWKSNQY